MNAKLRLSSLSLCILGMSLATGLRAFAEEPTLEQLRKYADDSSVLAFEYAERCEKAGDRATAEEYYLKSVKLDPRFEKGQAKLRSWYTTYKKPAAGGDVAKLADLIDWLGKAQLHDEATALAESLLTVDPECEKAHLFLGHEKVSGKWYTKEEVELAKLAAAKAAETGDFDKLTPREKKIFALKAALKGFDDKTDEDRRWLDCGPANPFVLCMEKSPNYNAEIMLDAFKQAVGSFSDLFNEKFGSTYDPKKVADSEVCAIYIFAGRDRYSAATGAPVWSTGHFEPATGRIYLYKDTPSLYETIFEQCTIQLIHVVSRMSQGDQKPPAGAEAFWFSEGLAQYMANFQRDAQGGFTLGAPSSQWVPMVRKQIKDQKCRSLREFLKLSQADVMAKSSDPKWTLETWAEAWGVVYFLEAFKDGKYRAKFLDYCKLELGGKGGFEAAKTCFGDLEDLDVEFEGFFRDMK